MSETPAFPVHEALTSQEVRFLTPEDIGIGYRLKPEERVEISAWPDPNRTPSGDPLDGNYPGMQRIASIEIAGGMDSPECIVYTVRITPSHIAKKSPLPQVKLVLRNSPRDRVLGVANLEPGKRTPIGRERPGQEELIDTVSRRHCTVGLKPSGNLWVQNHTPTNYTILRV